MIKNAEFLGGAAALESLPEQDLPEIAFIGRSNVGKSSLINRLTERKNLARTSATPGKTQEINLFEVTLREGNQKFILTDLPGFGFAKFSKRKREYLSMITVRYIQERTQLAAICLLNDCRREPKEEELAVRDLVWNSEKTLIVVATKIDKVKKNDRIKTLSTLSKHYNLETEDIVSAGEKVSVAPILERITLLCS